MTYRAIGLMSGSSLDGLDLVFTEISVSGNNWSYRILHADCRTYTPEWKERLQNATTLSAEAYLQLHSDYGHLLGRMVNEFIAENGLEYKVQLICSHGHTTFHHPAAGYTHQLGDGAAIAAETGIHVVSDLRNMDVALGGQGAPIVPIGELKLMPQFDYFLNLGGIANLSANTLPYTAFDVCPANRVLNLLAQDEGMEYDNKGMLAATGTLQSDLLEQLHTLPYYKKTFPKSLSNSFGTETIYPILKQSGYSTADLLRTYTEHIADEIRNALQLLTTTPAAEQQQLLVTGGGAFNDFLIQRLTEKLKDNNINVVLAEPELIQYKEALIMAFLGVLRWREESNVLQSVTGASRNSIGGAVWMGQPW